MSHAGNYSRAKIARLRAENASRDKAELATCELHDWGPDMLFGNLTPCTTFNYAQYGAQVQCAGCNRMRELKWSEFARTRVSHEPWHVLFRTLMTCDVCHHGPMSISFSRALSGGAGQRGCISRRPPPPRVI